MKKMLELIFEGTLFAVILRSLIVGPNLSDALVTIAIIGAMSYKAYLHKEKDEKLKAMEDKIAEYGNKVDLITLKMGIVDARKK